MRTALPLTKLLACVFGQNYLASYWSGQQALAPHSLDKSANFTPAYLTNCIRCFGLGRHQQQATQLLNCVINN